MIESISQERCDGCSDQVSPVCMLSCPNEVIEFNDGKGKAYIAHAEDCIVCYSCEMSCPQFAIKVSSETPEK